ncbi:transcriptional repressor [Paenibacillus sp. FSL W8-1187]|uniref:Zinc uptake regulation protein ZUR n=1 Tax=Paenibacillus pasadenensis TaxID=217090 RepID=A0A2N5N0P1_9BACL|nr:MULTISPECIES: transcriptional repressor [Paenibacillus]PLT43908.1 hypothetical protein B8V81_2339 [Paenibacillus pasadenensis]QGG54493.1 hypothetical protein GE073_01995 [Paenibacillus sp. B01]
MAIAPNGRNAAPSPLSPAAPSSACRLQDAVDQIEARGIRLNPQRYALLEYIYTADRLSTVEQLVRELHVSGHGRGAGATAVYSQLRVFERMGLVRESKRDGEVPCYGPALARSSRPAV